MAKIILKGKKVILRPLSLKDAPRFCHWLADPEVTNFLSVHGHKPPTIKEEKDWIKKASKEKNAAHFSIDTLNGVHIGSIALRDIDFINKKAEYGIVIGDKKYWGQGCGTEACRLIVNYGFRRLKLHNIYLSCIAFNIRGIKSYQKVGFKIQGRFRQHFYRQGHFHDEILMDLLKVEFLK